MAQERSDIERRTDVDHDAARLATDGPGDETRHIEGQIEETRAQLGETINAIQDRLSFAHLSGQVSDGVHNAVESAKEAVYDATIGKARGIMKNVGSGIAGSPVVKTAKDNPLPLALIGIGAGLLVYKAYSNRSGSSSAGRAFDDRYTESELQSSGDAVKKVSTAATATADKVTGALNNAYSGASDVLSDVQGTAREKYETYLQENPLALGVAALAVGAAVGMAIPATKYESELMGETQQNLLNAAQETATELLDKGKQALTDATGTPTGQKGSSTVH